MLSSMPCYQKELESHFSYARYQNIQYPSSIQFRSKVLHDAFVVHAVIAQ